MSDGAAEGGGPHQTHQRVVGLIGCPGSGKTTYARRYDPLDGWVHLTLDDIRQALWPPHRQIYWRVRAEGYDDEARQVLHRVKEAALEAALGAGFNVVMADTHLTQAVFARELEIVARYGIMIEWKLFDVPWDELTKRNKARALSDPAHRQPEHVLRLTYEAMRAPDAWWRMLPPQQLEVIEA
ncbi:AAA family ATPase [Methylobacterium sp.]|uniref:AAA family ATPase n=1 Tax=Methylobacterium sp. TaxID=409 RepID=UPI000C42D15C|nr:AAA family ATPase [Methylobacterium sp.]MBP27830.1 hypothetical protein [Methylobacterium sp.]